jgi:putative transposase
VTMAAYIDLNPVRAGLVTDPMEYRWCGYGEAVAGRRGARLGLQRLATALQQGQEASVSRSLEVYRVHLYCTGAEGREAVGEDGRPTKGSLPREDVVAVLEAKGKLPLSEFLRCKVRYFCDGAVFGSREFVEGIFREYRPRFGVKRRNGARKVKGLEEGEGEFYTLRNLRVRVFE